jgi:hypothetical protein
LNRFAGNLYYQQAVQLISDEPHFAHAARAQDGKPEFDKSTDESRTNLLHISARDGKAAGSWRTRVQLDPGRYRFEGEMRLRGVAAEN